MATYKGSRENAKVIRKALTERFGRANVRVTCGRGTAYSWLHVKVTLPSYLDPKRDADNGSSYKNNVPWRENQAWIDAIATKAVTDAGSSFSTYSADDGYNSERREINFDVRYHQQATGGTER